VAKYWLSEIRKAINLFNDIHSSISKSKNVEKALHNLEGSKSYYDKLGKGREWREMKRVLEKKLTKCTG